MYALQLLTQFFHDMWTRKMRTMLAAYQLVLDDMGAFLADCGTLFYVGRGYSVGNARLAALITQESSKIGAVGLSAGQFRHGPLELVREGFGMVLFGTSGPTRTLDNRLAEEVARLGGKCVHIGPEPCARSDRLLPWALPAVPPDVQ